MTNQEKTAAKNKKARELLAGLLRDMRKGIVDMREIMEMLEAIEDILI